MANFTTMKRSIAYLIVALLLLACEEEGEPLKPSDLASGGIVGNELFFAKVDVFDFKSNAANGKRVGNDFELTAVSPKGEKINIVLDRIEAGEYQGGEQSKNQVIYTTSDGKEFRSESFPNAATLVKIALYNKEAGWISGNFSSYVFNPGDKNDKYYLSQGRFSKLPINSVYEGEMLLPYEGTVHDSYECKYTMNTGGSYRINSKLKEDTLSLNINFPNSIKENTTYYVDSSQVGISFNVNTFSSLTSETIYYSQTGRVDIVSIDSTQRTIKGNFSFQAKSAINKSLEVQGGSFVALY
jgi:hypothetical protein